MAMFLNGKNFGLAIPISLLSPYPPRAWAPWNRRVADLAYSGDIMAVGKSESPRSNIYPFCSTACPQERHSRKSENM